MSTDPEKDPKSEAPSSENQPAPNLAPPISKANESQSEDSKRLRDELHECDVEIGKIEERKANCRYMNIHRRRRYLDLQDEEERFWTSKKEWIKQQIEELLRGPSGALRVEDPTPASPDAGEQNRKRNIAKKIEENPRGAVTVAEAAISFEVTPKTIRSWANGEVQSRRLQWGAKRGTITNESILKLKAALSG